MKKSTREWLGKAEADFLCAKALFGGRPPFHDIVCFHCQQCAEKHLKALLEELGLSIAKTHDLEKLLTTLIPHHPSLAAMTGQLQPLTDLAVDSRYPGNRANKRQTAAALRWAERVRRAARALLGLDMPRK